MNKLEAQAIIEETGNYDEEDTEYILEIYDELLKHKGWQDNRIDSRYIVKFPNIFYYTETETPEEEDLLNNLFDDFCEWQVESVEDYLVENNIDVEEMLSKMCCGHYYPFLVDIPEITDKNAIEKAMEIYNEFNYEGKYYVENYIKVVDCLQDLEDNYMEYWFDYIEGNEYFPEKRIKEMKEKYQKDIERRSAK